MGFAQGRSYTREFIRDELGGDCYSFLPESGDRIVCGCFNPEMNPEAPYEILVGGSGETGNRRKARKLFRQDGSIPVFLKQAVNEWIYRGHYRVVDLIEDRDYIERKQREADRSDVVLAFQLEAAEVEHNTYLLTWSPRRWAWSGLEEMVERTAQGQLAKDQWSCGNTKRIRPGDRLFLLRQRQEPRGIMAAGWATSEPFPGPHWDEDRQDGDEESLYVKLLFERILNPNVDEILTLDRLQVGPLASVHWGTQRSGIQIKQGVYELERLWSELTGRYEDDQADFEDIGAVEGEERMAFHLHRARERWLRGAKIAQAKAANNGRLPCEVPGCMFDFFEVYGEIGRDYAQVHHKRPLGDRTHPSQTKLSELAIVCANCHVMIHVGGGSRDLEDLLSPSRSIYPPIEREGSRQ